MRIIKSRTGVIKNIYYGQVSASKLRGHKKPDYTLKDLITLKYLHILKKEI